MNDYFFLLIWTLFNSYFLLRMEDDILLGFAISKSLEYATMGLDDAYVHRPMLNLLCAFVWFQGLYHLIDQKILCFPFQSSIILLHMMVAAFKSQL